MKVITIPKNLIKNDDLVVIPRREYEEFLRFRFSKIKEVNMTSQQKRILAQARKNLKKGKFLAIYELKEKLGIKD